MPNPKYCYSQQTNFLQSQAFNSVKNTENKFLANKDFN